MANTQASANLGSSIQPVSSGQLPASSASSMDVKLLQEIAAKHDLIIMDDQVIQDLKNRVSQLEQQLEALKPCAALSVDHPAASTPSPIAALNPATPAQILPAETKHASSQLKSVEGWVVQHLLTIKEILSSHEDKLQQHTPALHALKEAATVPSMAKHGVIGATGVMIKSLHGFMTYHTQLQNAYVIPLLARLELSHRLMRRGVRQLEAAVDAEKEIGKGYFIKCFDFDSDAEDEVYGGDQPPRPGESPTAWAHRVLAKQSPTEDTPEATPHPYSRISVPSHRRITPDYKAEFRRRRHALAAEWITELETIHQTSIAERNDDWNEHVRRQAKIARIGCSEDDGGVQL